MRNSEVLSRLQNLINYEPRQKEIRLRKVAYKKGVKIRTFTLKPEYICDPAEQAACPHAINK